MEKQELVDALKKDLGENLLCIAEYGLTEKQFVVVVGKISFEVLLSIQDTTRKLSKKGVYPMFITREELFDGADVFPLEFLNIKFTCEILYGEDVFDRMHFEKEQVRRELEFTFRSKLITLRQGFLEAAHSREDLAVLVSHAIPTLSPVCVGMLYLKDLEVPKNLDELLRAISRAYGLKLDVLSVLSKKDPRRLTIHELKSRVKELIEFLSEFGEVFDEIKV